MSRNRILIIAAVVLGSAGIVIGALGVTRNGGGDGASHRRPLPLHPPKPPASAAVSCSRAASCPSKS